MKDIAPRRKPHRLPLLWYRGAKCHFVTICCFQRAKLLTSKTVPAVTQELKVSCVQHSFSVYAYCFMPNHFHRLFTGMGESADLIALMRTFKGKSAARVRAFGTWRLWQKGFYDHIVRREESLNAIAWYILSNPVRARLAKSPGDWPFSHWEAADWRRKTAPAETYMPPWKTTNENAAG